MTSHSIPRQSLPFLFWLIGLLTIAFAVHITTLYQLELTLWDNKIVLAYIINGLIAIGIFYMLLFLKEKFAHILGFVFMFASFFKFGIFFLLFYPSYMYDEAMGRDEFAAFYIPYAISLIVEVKSLTNILKN